MTKEQSDAIRATVDAGGWDAVRENPELNAIWQENIEESRRYVNDCVDRD